MSNITSEFEKNNGQNNYGKIGVPRAIMLLDKIEQFLGDASQYTQYDASILKNFATKMKQSVSETHTITGTKVELPRNISVESQINLQPLLNNAKQHLVSENKFKMSVYSNNLSDAKIIERIKTINETIVRVDNLLVIVTMNMPKTSDALTFKKDGIQFGVCNNSKFTFEYGMSQQQITNELKTITEQVEIREKLMETKNELPKMERTISELINKRTQIENEIGIKTIGEFEGKIQDYTDFITTSLEDIELLRRGRDSIEADIVWMYNNVIYKILRNHKKLAEIKNITDENVNSVVSFIDKLKPTLTEEECNTQMNAYALYVISTYYNFNRDHPNSKAYQKKHDWICSIFGKDTNGKVIDQCNIKNVSKIVTINPEDVKEQLLPMINGETILGIKGIDPQLLLNYIIYKFKLEQLKTNYDKYTKIRVMYNKNHIKPSESAKIYENQLIEFKKIINQITILQHDIDIIKDPNTQKYTNELKQTIIQLQQKERELNENIMRINNEVEKDIDETIDIFNDMKKYLQMINKYYKTIDTSEIIFDNFDNLFDNENKIMIGGTKYDFEKFAENIKSDITRTSTIRELLTMYCNRSGALKSKYTALYNKFREWNKIVINMIMYNLFRLTTIRDINKDKIFVPRYITYKNFIEMREYINSTAVYKDIELQNKYFTVIDNAKKLLSVVQYTNKENCIDIMTSQYILEFILLIVFYNNQKKI